MSFDTASNADWSNANYFQTLKTTVSGVSSYNVIATSVTSKTTGTQPANSVVQSWIQFRDWDNQSTADVPSYANLVCNNAVTTSSANGTALRSCGSATLASKTSGVYTSIKGQTSSNLSTCTLNSVLFSSEYTKSADGDIAVCQWARAFELDNLTTLALQSDVNFIAGFNIFGTLRATTI